jgi:hypothetical protein
MSDAKKPGTFEKGKGKDPRINRKGRPKNFDELRALAKQIAHEPIKAGDKRFTVVEAIMRQWAQSKDPRLQQAFIAYAYGKVPENVELTGKDGKDLPTSIVNVYIPDNGRDPNPDKQ